MEDENTNLDGQVDASQLNAPTPEESVSNVSADGLTLAEINAATGKNFPTKDAFLKSYRDTASYVGKKIEDIRNEVLAENKNSAATDQLAKELEEMRKERFYDKNPQYADPAIRKFIESTGKNPAELVNTPEFKDIFAKVSGYDENQKLRTVLESNPRLSSSRDSLSKAREVSMTSQSTSEVESLVVNAVKDAYGM